MTEITFAVAWVVAVAGMGGWLTRLDEWYYELDKPPWQPPDWLFGPAWTTIFLCAAVALVVAWRAAPEPGAILAVYIVNGLLNMIWSFLFFRLHRPDIALLETIGLWLSIVAIMVVIAPHAGAWTMLLLPYLLWVTFAFVLNAAIVRRNRPFGSGTARPGARSR